MTARSEAIERAARALLDAYDYARDYEVEEYGRISALRAALSLPSSAPPSDATGGGCEHRNTVRRRFGAKCLDCDTNLYGESPQPAKGCERCGGTGELLEYKGRAGYRSGPCPSCVGSGTEPGSKP